MALKECFPQSSAGYPMMYCLQANSDRSIPVSPQPLLQGAIQVPLVFDHKYIPTHYVSDGELVCNGQVKRT